MYAGLWCQDKKRAWVKEALVSCFTQGQRKIAEAPLSGMRIGKLQPSRLRQAIPPFRQFWMAFTA